MTKRTPVKIKRAKATEANKWAVIGVDGGLSGAFATVNSNLHVINFWDMPVVELKKKVTRGPRKGKTNTKREFSPRLIFNQLENEKLRLRDLGYSVKIVLEKAMPMPKQGLASTFQTGRGYGLMEGILVALGLPYEIITPKEWQKVMLTGLRGGDTKEKSLLKASQLFPNLTLTKPKGKKLTMDGRADAALMACYAVQKLRSGQ